MAMTTYYDYAWNDHQFFDAAYQSGDVWNGMAALAQNCCEKYLKYLIERYHDADSKDAQYEKEDAMRSHNLNKLIRHLEQYTDLRISKLDKLSLMQINGFYFSARYPGEDSMDVNREDIENCKEAVDTCKELTDKVILEKERIQSANALKGFLETKQIPEHLKEDIICASAGHINWNEVPDELLQSIIEKYPSLSQEKFFVARYNNPLSAASETSDGEEKSVAKKKTYRGR